MAWTHSFTDILGAIRRPYSLVVRRAPPKLVVRKAPSKLIVLTSLKVSVKMFKIGINNVIKFWN